MQQNLLYIDNDILVSFNSSMNAIKRKILKKIKLQEARNRGAADLLEIPHSSITMGREIGKGAFGR